MTKVRILVAPFSCVILTAALAVQATCEQAPAGTQSPAAPAQSNAQGPNASTRPLPPIVRFQAANISEPAGDQLAQPRLIAAAIVAQDDHAPKMVVDVGSFTGEFLEAFMERFPNARGQWTDGRPVIWNEDNAKRRFARFGDRVNYVIGCPGRDISLGCVPKNVDVLLTSWLSAHQDLDGINKFYRLAYGMLPPGGWLMNLDHITASDSAWEQRLQTARKEFHAKTEGPPARIKTPAPTIDAQMAAFKAAGFDVDIVWRSFTTVLFVAHKR